MEEYNKEAAVQFGAQAIQTAMSSTQVVDGFFLKRTASIDDTIEYLVTLNTMVQKMYEVKSMARSLWRYTRWHTQECNLSMMIYIHI